MKFKIFNLFKWWFLVGHKIEVRWLKSGEKPIILLPWES